MYECRRQNITEDRFRTMALISTREKDNQTVHRIQKQLQYILLIFSHSPRHSHILLPIQFCSLFKFILPAGGHEKKLFEDIQIPWL